MSRENPNRFRLRCATAQQVSGFPRALKPLKRLASAHFVHTQLKLALMSGALSGLAPVMAVERGSAFDQYRAQVMRTVFGINDNDERAFGSVHRAPNEMRMSVPAHWLSFDV